MKQNSKHLLFFLLFIVAIAAFLKLGKQSLYEWDESHTVINAIEMLQNKDWINLYYVGEPDEIRAKPPLFIWIVAASFQLFEANTFSLRLPSALFSILAFFYIFKIICLYKAARFAFFTGLILVGVKGIIGFHVGRTGDFDAMLVACLLGGLYYFLKYLDFNQKRAIYWAALFFGLAFMTKGPAMGVLFPGIGLYVLLSGRFSKLMQSTIFWKAVGLCLVFPLVWMLTIYFFGVSNEHSKYAGDNAFERMFLYDLVERFTSSQFENQREQSDAFFFFRCLEESFLYWNYVFYLIALGGIYRFFFRTQLSEFIQNRFRISTKDIHTVQDILLRRANRLPLLSICIWLPLGLFLSIVTTAKWWYMAPAIPFLAVTTYYGIDWLQQRYVWVKYLFLILLATTLGKRYLDSLDDQARRLVKAAEAYCTFIHKTQKVTFLYSLPRQDVLGHLYFCNPSAQFRKAKHQEELSLTAPGLVIIPKKYYSSSKIPAPYRVVLDDNYFVLLYWLH